jgi:hypothetical protein
MLSDEGTHSVGGLSDGDTSVHSDNLSINSKQHSNHTTYISSNGTNKVTPNIADQWNRISASLEFERQKQANPPIHSVLVHEPNHHLHHDPNHHHHVTIVDNNSDCSGGGGGGNTSSSIHDEICDSNDYSYNNDDVPSQNTNAIAFKKKRDAHYNEFKLIQAMKIKEQERKQRKLQRQQELILQTGNINATVDTSDSDDNSNDDDDNMLES